MKPSTDQNEETDMANKYVTKYTRDEKRTNEKAENERRQQMYNQQNRRARYNDASQVKDVVNDYNNRNAKQRDYANQQRRAQNQDNQQIRDMLYDNNRRDIQAREQRRKENESYQTKASRDEHNAMDRTNRENAKKTHQDYVNRGYNKEEAAFNRGRNEAADRMDNTRRRNERALNNLPNQLKDKMSKNVPSTRPGESGREWEDHKYIDKVETKTGKIRYIYDIDTSSGHHNANSSKITDKDMRRAKDELNKAKNSLTRPTNPKAILKETSSKSNSRNSGGGDKLHDPLSEISRAARNAQRVATSAMKSASKAVSDGAKYVSDALSDIAKNTPLKDIFK